MASCKMYVVGKQADTWQSKCEAQVLDADAVHRHRLGTLSLEPGLVAGIDRL